MECSVNHITMACHQLVAKGLCMCFDGVVITAQCTATFSDLCAPPNLGSITRTCIWRLNFAQRPIFSGLRFFSEPEISDSGPPDKVPVLRIFTS